MTNSVSVTAPHDEIGLSSKKFQESTSHQQQVAVDLGLKLEQDNQDRSFLSKSRIVGDDDDDKNSGPTYNSYHNTTNINSPILYSTTTTTTSPTSVDNSSTRTPPPTTTTTGGYVRGSGLQPFDVCSSYANPFLKYSGGMTTTMGFPFTSAQWKELERQAMIYKYMMASLPVPPDLLYSSFPTHFSPSHTFPPASYFLGKYGSEISMRWSGNSKDAEPGRCRRTDGKKWRCSKDVAPNQKYCERHMHRGRPRSRKHVEQQLLLQQQQQQQSSNNLSFNTSNDKNNDDNVPTNTVKKTKLSDSCSIPRCVGSSGSNKASVFDHPLVSGGNSNPFEVSRNLAWNEEQQWNHLVQQAHMTSTVFQNRFEGEPLNLNSHTGFNSKSLDIGSLERPLIDAWSMGISGNKNHGDKVSLSSLNGVNPNANAISEEICQIHMGLGLIDSWASTTPTPGGPLAEVLRPNNVTMSDVGESEFVTPPATAVSSPSGVLQKNFATFSDSSGSNSPTTCNNSKTSSEMPFNWLN